VLPTPSRACEPTGIWLLDAYVQMDLVRPLAVRPERPVVLESLTTGGPPNGYEAFFATETIRARSEETAEPDIPHTARLVE
jgi:hypothetical protein